LTLFCAHHLSSNSTCSICCGLAVQPRPVFMHFPHYFGTRTSTVPTKKLLQVFTVNSSIVSYM